MACITAVLFILYATMSRSKLPSSLDGARIHMVGIKGTGMVGLADVLQCQGAVVTGSDTDEVFYTDEILKQLRIPYQERFSSENLSEDVQLVVHSPAYSASEHPELREAISRDIPVLSYPETVGCLSRRSDASGICGTHGKSTTTAMVGTILKRLGLPVTILNAAAVGTFGGRSSLVTGNEFLVAETCEYRRHFLHFSPQRIVVTCVEEDHLDYFRDLEDIVSAFVEYILRLPKGGSLVYNADDAGLLQVVEEVCRKRGDILLWPYGRQASGPYRIEEITQGEGMTSFRLAGLQQILKLQVPGLYSVWNATAAIALSILLHETARARRPEDQAVRDALALFSGCRRRSEVVGQAAGVLFLDDYAHHPTAVAKTLAGLRSFYPGRRIVVDFMAHTYSRTKALLAAFGTCFGLADEVILHRIYASAREQNEGAISGRDLYREVAKSHERVSYFDEVLAAEEYVVNLLKTGDLFVTVGAGDNWRLGRLIHSRFKEREPTCASAGGPA